MEVAINDSTMDLDDIDPRRYSLRTVSLVGIIALLLFCASYLVDVRIVVESPNYGDVTAGVAALWRLVLGVTTVGSFAIGIYSLVADDDESDGPAMGFEIKGEDHDIDIYLQLPDEEAANEDETAADEDESGSGDSSNRPDGERRSGTDEESSNAP